ncbi:hypothetical protein AAV98_05700 [Bacillus sp. CHD6a]|nr:hypothetical protein AAV98_05700 [Bacillus sp. CHD6a]
MVETPQRSEEAQAPSRGKRTRGTEINRELSNYQTKFYLRNQLAQKRSHQTQSCVKEGDLIR